MLADVSLLFADFSATLSEALPVILGLIMIEGLLSVDNALAIAAMASHLKEDERKRAMNIGYLGAYGFRILALFFAAWLISIPAVLYLGAGYLLWLMCDHFSSSKAVHSEVGEELHTNEKDFGGTIMRIALLDLSLSVDNVVAAVAMSSDKIAYVIIGVSIGIITLRLVAGVAVKMIEKYPILEPTAYVLIGFVGMLLLYELMTHVHIAKIYKFVGILGILGTAILYSRSEAVAKILKPFLRASLLPMQMFMAVTSPFTLLVSWPVNKLMGMFRKA